MNEIEKKEYMNLEKEAWDYLVSNIWMWRFIFISHNWSKVNEFDWF